MWHLFRFVAGVLTGMAATSLIRSRRARAGLEKAEDTLRDVTVATLEAVESASARARTRLAGEEPEAAPAPVPSKPGKSSRRRAVKDAAASESNT